MTSRIVTEWGLRRSAVLQAGLPGDVAELAGVKVVERLPDLCLCVHHEHIAVVDLRVGPEGDLVLDADDGAPRGAVSGLHGVSLRVFELGRRLGWEKRRLHHQLSRMCRRGLVQRHSGDGRAIHAAGRAALKAAVPHHAQPVRRLVLDRLTPQQIDQLADISRTILDGLDRP